MSQPNPPLSPPIRKHHDSDKVRPMYARHSLLGPTPRHSIPRDGMAPSTAYNLIHDELILDGSSRFNLATFCSTWMEPEAHKLMAETFDKNMIDKDEYPQTAELEMRCVHMLAELWNSPDAAETIGTSTIGSSEACMLGGLALKWRWRRADAPQARTRAQRRAAQPGDGNQHPGLLAQVLPLLGRGGARSCARRRRSRHRSRARRGCLRRKHHRRCLRAGQHLYRPLRECAGAQRGARRASGAHRARYSRSMSMAQAAALSRRFSSPICVWDFRLPRVKSINTSGHKYGLVYPGVGWIVWREPADLDETWFSKSIIWAGPCPRWPSTSRVRRARSSRSTTTSSGWAAPAIAPCTRPAAKWLSNWPARLPSSDRSRCSPRDRICP